MREEHTPMESAFSFIGLNFGRDQESAPPSDAGACQLKNVTRMVFGDIHGPSEAF